MKTSGIRTIILGAVALQNPGGELPKKFKILNWGDNPNAYGVPVRVGSRFAEILSAPTNPFKKIPIDFQHNTVPGTAAYAESKEPRAIAGYCELEAIPGDGIYARVLSWTDDGRAHAKDFSDVSAAIVQDEKGNVLMINSVALCRCGAVPGMEFKDVSVALSAEVAELLAPELEQQKKDETMDYKQFLITFLGLKPEATDDEIKCALNALKKAPDDDAAEKAALACGGKKTAAMAADIEKMRTEIAGMRADIERREKNDIIAAARAEGKVVTLSAEAVAKLSTADLQAVAEKTPVTMPVTAVGGKVAEKALAAGVTPEQRQIALACGADPEKVFGTEK